MTHVFLIVVSLWSMAYRGDQRTPAFVREMPDAASCQAVGEAIVDMGKAQFRCVEVKP